MAPYDITFGALNSRITWRSAPAGDRGQSLRDWCAIRGRNHGSVSAEWRAKKGESSEGKCNAVAVQGSDASGPSHATEVFLSPQQRCRNQFFPSTLVLWYCGTRFLPNTMVTPCAFNQTADTTWALTTLVQPLCSILSPCATLCQLHINR